MSKGTHSTPIVSVQLRYIAEWSLRVRTELVPSGHILGTKEIPVIQGPDVGNRVDYEAPCCFFTSNATSGIMTDTYRALIPVPHSCNKPQ
jgi:hypothetical protein